MSSSRDGDDQSPRVFISYSHDSPEHMAKVLDLSDRLREEGVDADIDQYVESPPEGFPAWSRRQIEEADFVPMVFTETYARRFTGDGESGEGLGARWEGAVITQELYEAGGRNQKFIPIAFESKEFDHIPIVLSGVRHYNVSNRTDYDRFYMRLTSQKYVERPKLGRVRRVSRSTVKPSADQIRSVIEPMPPRAPKSDARFPHLAHDVRNAGEIVLNGTNYRFRLYSVGERGGSVEPELIDEVVDGLAEEITALGADLDYLVTVEPGGTRWVFSVAQKLRKPVKIVNLEPSGAEGQLHVSQHGSFYTNRELYFPTLEPDKRVVVLDDVVSTGGTMRTLVTSLRDLCKVEVVGVCCIVDKTGASELIHQDEGIPVRSLIKVDG